MIAELVSDGSVTKDTQRLPTAYYRAGVREYWLVDARPDPLLFQIHVRDRAGFEPVDTDDQGYQYSEVFGCSFRLDRQRDQRGNWAYDLHSRQ